MFVQEPVSKYMVVARHFKERLPHSAFDRQIEDVLDIISYRLQTQHIDEVAESVLDKLFELRIQFLEWFFDNKTLIDLFTELDLAFSREWATKMQISPYSDLAQRFAETLDIYHHIVREAGQSFQANASGGFDLSFSDEAKPTYETIKLFTQHPSPRFRFYKPWLDASLKLDFGWLVAEMALADQLRFSDQMASELAGFLRRQAVRFGACSIFTEFWIPTDEEGVLWLNQMQVLAATFELEHLAPKPITSQDFYQMTNIEQ